MCPNPIANVLRVLSHLIKVVCRGLALLRGGIDPKNIRNVFYTNS
jgi:hypothetical protein